MTNVRAPEGFYLSREGHAYAPATDTQLFHPLAPDPYKPGSPKYTERNAVTTIPTVNGMTRVDIGRRINI
jgi:hypothetical protein